MAKRELDDLYALPLDEFTRARDELARTLRKAGDRDAAEDVRGLSKPTVSAWAVNQLARRRPADIGELTAIGRSFRTAQRRGGGDALRDAARRQRELVDRLTTAARELFADAGRPASDTVLQRVAGTLRAASVEPSAAKAVEEGRLAQDLTATGFGPALVAVAEEAPRRRPRADAASRERARRQEQVAEVRGRLKDARAELRELRREADRAEAEAKRAQRAAEEAVETAENARRRAAEAEEHADELDAELARLRKGG